MTEEGYFFFFSFSPAQQARTTTKIRQAWLDTVGYWYDTHTVVQSSQAEWDVVCGE